MVEHTVAAGERLDTVTARYLGDPTQFWQICDANHVLEPDELEVVGGTVHVALPRLMRPIRVLIGLLGIRLIAVARNRSCAATAAGSARGPDRRQVTNDADGDDGFQLTLSSAKNEPARLRPARGPACSTRSAA